MLWCFICEDRWGTALVKKQWGGFTCFFIFYLLSYCSLLDLTLDTIKYSCFYHTFQIFVDNKMSATDWPKELVTPKRPVMVSRWHYSFQKWAKHVMLGSNNPSKWLKHGKTSKALLLIWYPAIDNVLIMLAKLKKACPFYPPYVAFGTVISTLLVMELLTLLELCSCYAVAWVEK